MKSIPLEFTFKIKPLDMKLNYSNVLLSFEIL